MYSLKQLTNWKTYNNEKKIKILPALETTEYDKSDDIFLTPFFKSIQPRLSKIAGDLSSISKDTEDEFLKIGKNLQEFLSVFTENSSRASSIAQFIESGSGFNINSFGELFENARKDTESSAEAISNGISSMSASMSNIEKVADLRLFLKKLSRSITILGSLIRIETARVGKAEFTIITSGIDDLAKQIEEGTNDIAISSKEAKVSIKEIIKKMTECIEDLKKGLGISRERLNDILNEVGRMATQAQWACKRIDGRAVQIRSEISEVVGDLQYHDICRQQMEHVSEALIDLASKISGINKKSGNELTAFCRLIIETIWIQLSQLEQVINKTAASYDGISTHLSRVADLTEAQAEETEDLLAEEESESRKIIKINNEISSLSNLISNLKDMTTNLIDPVSKATDNIGKMSEQLLKVEAIRDNINLLALNAIVKVARASDTGRGLEVLAEQIKNLSKSAKEEISRGEEVINATLNNSAELKENLSKDLKKQLLLTDQICTKTNGAVEELLNADKKLMQLISEVTKIAQNLQNDIFAQISEICFVDIIKSRVGSVVTKLKEMVNEILEKVSDVNEAELDEILPDLNSLKKHYTMQSERDAHESRFEGRDKNNEEISEPAKGTESALGDNVELF